MRSARRWYIYVMSFAALVAMSVGITNLAGALIAAAFGLGLSRESVATWAGVLVIAFPLFLGHALWTSRLATTDAEERGAALRKAYVYAAAGLGVLLLALGTREALALSIRALLGKPVVERAAWTVRLLNRLVTAAWGGAIVWYVRLLIRQDDDLGQERGLAATWRRLFIALVGTVGVLLFVVGVVRAGQTLLLMLVPPVSGGGRAMGAWWQDGLAAGLSTAVTSVALWRVGWSAERQWGERFPGERDAVARQAFYYVGVALGLGTFLVALAYLLRQGMLGLLGEPWGPRQAWWPRMAAALVGVPTGAGVWAVYRAAVVAEHPRPPVPHFRLAVGRLYMYVVAAVSLAVAWWGVMTLIRVVTRALVSPAGYSLTPFWWRPPLANGMALTLVALPTWAWHWYAIQRVAVTDSAAGTEERSSLIRRVYLYGVSLAAGLTVLVYLAQVARQAWLWVLGVPRPELMDGLVNASGPALVALLAWVYHMAVLRQDMRRLREVATRRARLLAERERLLRRLQEIDAILNTLDKEEEEA